MNNSTPLIDAARRGDADAVRAHLHEATQRDTRGWTALMHASARNFVECVKALIPYERGLADPQKITALMIAADNGHTEVVRLLAKEEPRLQNSDGWTALMHASYRGFDECAELLLDEAGIQTTRRKDGMAPGSTALMVAARFSRPECVELLRDREKGFVDSEGHDALWYAENKGVNPNVKTSEVYRNKHIIDALTRIVSSCSVQNTAYEEKRAQEGVRNVPEPSRKRSPDSTNKKKELEDEPNSVIRMLRTDLSKVKAENLWLWDQATKQGEYIKRLEEKVEGMERERERSKEKKFAFSSLWPSFLLGYGSTRNANDELQKTRDELEKTKVELERTKTELQKVCEKLLIYESKGDWDMHRPPIHPSTPYPQGGYVWAVEDRTERTPMAQMDSSPNTDPKMTPLMKAILTDDTQAFQNASNYVGRCDSHERSALMYGAALGKDWAVKALMDHESCLSDINGWTALMHAAYNGHVECVNLLTDELGMQTTKTDDPMTVALKGQNENPGKAKSYVQCLALLQRALQERG
ncbi:Ankyrin repeat protein 1 [Giardia muris]|uniref:Ankyrin repeat protein 1 n=1 Tax=Giardia muris TaxID=5742 RepID=A0A4Z1T8J0_GIAMU|nr:Ankyrin repeat protein 1 [Giardia muris]|eukprot:TNJ29447.1 Ankyrin repeat protein 1 [Giardia muris]